ncbi:MAG: hypothetical protein GF388_02230 [Candidatus Aegiribacteria sp.]|nr:hypothetical protein [Candidatus Aegiribacteria sp.]MBD3294140.1 hypothetical protein [Candidatus Fermentibacteria bacterium]
MERFIPMVLSLLFIVTAACDDSTYPFDEVTDTFTFTYELPQQGEVDVPVLNCYMNTVRTLVSDSTLAAGSHTDSWDLTDQAGQRVPDGLYYIRIELGGEVVDTQLYEVHQ